jgi:uroporphyrinogen-III synthase
LIAVGDRSAAAARDAGFTDVTSAGGTAVDLAALVALRCAGERPLLYLAGAHRSVDLTATLAGVTPVEMRVIYHAVGNPILPAAVADALRQGTLKGVLHFSRRTAQIYLDAATRAGLYDAALTPAHYCLSARIAEPLAAAGAASIRIAERPTENSLISLLNSG